MAVFSALASDVDTDSSGTLATAEIGMGAEGDGKMTLAEPGGFMKSVGETLRAVQAAAPSGGPPPGGGPAQGGSDTAESSVSSLLESTLTTQTKTDAAIQSQSNSALIAQFPKLLAQVA